MRILIATPLYPPESGGPATYTKLLEERLPSHGFNVSVLAFKEVRYLPKIIRHLVFFFKCLNQGRETDLIFAQDTVSVGVPAMLAAKMLRKPFIVRVPGDYAWEQGRQRFGVKETMERFVPHLSGWKVSFLHRIQAWVVRGARFVIAPSEYLRGHILRWNTSPDRVVRIFNGVSLPVPVQEPTAVPAGFLIVSVGRLVKWKGMSGILKCLRDEPAWKAVIVGDGPEREELEKSARELGIEERVTFTGGVPREQALGWIKRGSVFVLNSSYEGLSHQLIEAMSLGVPIVATKIGGNPELITDRREGLLVPPYNVAALHKALTEIERDPQRAKELGLAAASRARDFSIERTLGGLRELLKKV